MCSVDLDNVKTLDELFAIWMESQEYKNAVEALKKKTNAPIYFVKDGIVEKYGEEKKVLYILRDAHVTDVNNPDQDLRAAFRQSCKGEGKTWNNVGRWTLALLDGVDAYETIRMDADILRTQLCRVAVMNLKKASGGSKAMCIEEFVQSQAKFIFTEIRLIDPDIIVTCEGELLREIFKKAKPSQEISASEDYPDAFFRYTVQLNDREVNVVNLYHPQAGRNNGIMFRYICDMRTLLK